MPHPLLEPRDRDCSVIALARAAGTSYHDLVRAEICDPLALADTTGEPTDVQRPRLATGHRRRGRPRDAAWDFDALAGAGCAVVDRQRRPHLPGGSPRASSGAARRRSAAGARRSRCARRQALACMAATAAPASWWHNGGTAGFRSMVVAGSRAEPGAPWRCWRHRPGGRRCRQPRVRLKRRRASPTARRGRESEAQSFRILSTSVQRATARGCCRCRAGSPARSSLARSARERGVHGAHEARPGRPHRHRRDAHGYADAVRGPAGVSRAAADRRAGHHAAVRGVRARRWRDHGLPRLQRRAGQRGRCPAGRPPVVVVDVALADAGITDRRRWMPKRSAARWPAARCRPSTASDGLTCAWADRDDVARSTCDARDEWIGQTWRAFHGPGSGRCQTWMHHPRAPSRRPSRRIRRRGRGRGQDLTGRNVPVRRPQVGAPGVVRVGGRSVRGDPRAGLGLGGPVLQLGHHRGVLVDADHQQVARRWPAPSRGAPPRSPRAPSRPACSGRRRPSRGVLPPRQARRPRPARVRAAPRPRGR